MSNAKLKYVKLDCDFFGKAKQKALLVDHGAEAVLYLLRIYALLAATTTGKITVSAALGCAFDVGVPKDKATELLAVFTTPSEDNPEEGSLLQLKDGVVFLDRIIEDKEEVASKRERDAERQRQKRDTSATPERQKDEKESDISATPYNYSYSSSCSSNSEEETVTPHPADSPVEPKPPEPESQPDPYAELALEHLEAPADQPWTRTNQFINVGRRPMKKFPNLFFTPEEFAMVCRDYLESGIPERLRLKAFGMASTQVSTHKSRGQPPTGHASMLVGWIKTQILAEWTAEERLKKVRAA